jgi:hypothetical protein
MVNPDVVFLEPENGDVITDNTTRIEVSVPPYSGAEYVVYYGSADNMTWARLGQSPVVGNLSELMWSVPQFNGKYYLKAEHYSPWGLQGIAYTQVLIAHEILPVDLSTILMQGQDWLMFSLTAVSGLLLLLVFVPFFRKRPVIYDTSALLALGRYADDKERKLSDKTIRPDTLPPGIESLSRVKVVAINSMDDAGRLEREYALSPYDAMAIVLAKETGARLYSYDTRIVGICKDLGIKAELLKRQAGRENKR